MAPALALQLVASGRAAETSATGLSPADAQRGIELALLDKLSESAATTDVATAALRSALQTAGLTPLVTRAIQAVLNNLEATRRLATGSLNDGPALQANPNFQTGSGGGSAYRQQ